MAIKKYYDSDCNLGVLDGKTVAVIGFGSQGHAHSENLAESGVNVVVGLRKGSAHWEKASEFAATHDNFKVMEVEEAAKAGDVVMMLVPDELCADIYNTQVAPYMTEGKALAFAHGFNIHFKTITAPKNVDVIMIAPKGPGHIVRRLYTEGEGCPSLICVEQDYTGKAKDIDTIATGKRLGHPVRCLKNPFTRDLFKQEYNPNISDEELEKMGAGALRKAAKEGDEKNGSFMAGQCAAMVHKEQPAKEMIEEMFAEAEQILRGASQFCK